MKTKIKKTMNLYPFLQNSYFVNPKIHQNSTHKFVLFLSILIAIFFVACFDGAPSERGSITFTATHDCDIRLFDSQGRQIARDSYEVGKPPTIINMKTTGLFFVLAETPDGKTKKEPIPFPGGNIEHYIEF